MKLQIIWLTSIIPLVSAVSETLQTSSINKATGFRPADLKTNDKDGNGDVPNATNVQGETVIRINTSPKFGDSNPENDQEDNYLFLPYVTNPANNEMVRLKYTYTHEIQCYTFSDPRVKCKDYALLYLVSVASSSVPVKNIDVVNNKLAVFNLSAATGDVPKDHIIKIPSGTAGYRLVFHDEGASFRVTSLSLTRYYCHYITDAQSQLPMRCPDTPATNERDTTAQCTCADPNSSPNSGRSTIELVCAYNGDHTMFKKSTKDLHTTCDCHADYKYTSKPNDDRYCAAKPTTASTTTPTTQKPKNTSPQPITNPSSASHNQKVSSSTHLSPTTQRKQLGVTTNKNPSPSKTASSAPKTSNSTPKTKVTDTENNPGSGASGMLGNWVVITLLCLVTTFWNQ